MTNYETSTELKFMKNLFEKKKSTIRLHKKFEHANFELLTKLI